MRTRYLQSALTGSQPKERHKCKVPCTGKHGNYGAARRLFGFWNPELAKAHVVRVTRFEV